MSTTNGIDNKLKPKDTPVTKITKILSDVRILIGLTIGTLATVFGGGWVAMAQVQDVARDTAKAEVVPVVQKQDATKHSLDAHIDDSAIVHKAIIDRLEKVSEELKENRQDQRAIREDLRKMDRGQPLPPLPPLDGGTR